MPHSLEQFGFLAKLPDSQQVKLRRTPPTETSGINVIWYQRAKRKALPYKPPGKGSARILVRSLCTVNNAPDSNSASC